MPKTPVPAGQDQEAAISQSKPMQRFVAMLELEATVEASGSNDAFIEQLAEAMIEAEDFDAAIAVADNVKIPSGKDLAERNAELQINDFTIVKSDDAEKETPLKHYLRFSDAIDLDTGEPIVAATGAMNVLIPLVKARNKGQLPVQIRFYLDGRVVKIKRINRPIPGVAF